MPKLDWEPTHIEIWNAAMTRYPDRYNVANDLLWSNDNQSLMVDLEHMVEQELFREKRLQAEAEDAIVSI
jgi:hypothetical protein